MEFSNILLRNDKICVDYFKTKFERKQWNEKILEILLAMDKCLQVIGLGSNICQKYIKPKRLSFLTLFVVVPI